MSFHLLQNWIAKNRPDLDAQLSGMRMEKALDVLNRETGLNIQPHEQIAESSRQFLDALKAKQEAQNV